MKTCSNCGQPIQEDSSKTPAKIVAIIVMVSFSINSGRALLNHDLSAGKG